MIEVINEWEEFEAEPTNGEGYVHAGNVKGTKLHPETLTVAEVRQLLDCHWIGENPKHDARVARGRALIIVMWRGMLRCDEALRLRPTDVNLDNGEIRVLHGKGSKARTVAIDEAAAAIVMEWLVIRTQAMGCVSGPYPLFCHLSGPRRGKGFSPNNIRHWIAKLGEEAGIEKRVHVHGLRHSGACELRKAGVEIGIISKALGHNNIATTSRYLDHIAPTDVIDTMRSLKW